MLSDGTPLSMPFDRSVVLDFSDDRGSIILAAVPEPASIRLLILGVGAVAKRRRIRPTAVQKETSPLVSDQSRSSGCR